MEPLVVQLEILLDSIENCYRIKTQDVVVLVNYRYNDNLLPLPISFNINIDKSEVGIKLLEMTRPRTQEGKDFGSYKFNTRLKPKIIKVFKQCVDIRVNYNKIHGYHNKLRSQQRKARILRATNKKLLGQNITFVHISALIASFL